jgi:hypothetical protein
MHLSIIYSRRHYIYEADNFLVRENCVIIMESDIISLDFYK